MTLVETDKGVKNGVKKTSYRVQYFVDAYYVSV